LDYPQVVFFVYLRRLITNRCIGTLAGKKDNRNQTSKSICYDDSNVALSMPCYGRFLVFGDLGRYAIFPAVLPDSEQLYIFIAVICI